MCTPVTRCSQHVNLMLDCSDASAYPECYHMIKIRDGGYLTAQCVRIEKAA